jgi:RNA polymerase sigma-70 factor (ECF subfamily)
MKLTRLAPRAEAADDGEAARSLEQAFALYQDELLGTLFHLVGNAEDARDALQETFVKCWRNRDGLSVVENLKAWIFRVALNTGRDLRRAAGRRRRLLQEGAHEMLVTTERHTRSELEDAEELALVRRAVSDLRPEEQDVFLLRQNAGLTYDQIGRELGIPPGTVRTRMRLAIAKLRVALAAQ